VERYVAKRRADKMAPASINRELAFLKRVFSVAAADGLVDSNPVDAVRFFRENNARVRYLTPEEEERLCKAMPAEHWPRSPSRYTRDSDKGTSSASVGPT
jgi:site-specific recombinase XerD